MTTIVVEVSISYDGHINDDDAIEEVVLQIADALEHSDLGLVPTASDVVAKTITISEPFSGTLHTVHL